MSISNVDLQRAPQELLMQILIELMFEKDLDIKTNGFQSDKYDLKQLWVIEIL